MAPSSTTAFWSMIAGTSSRAGYIVVVLFLFLSGLVGEGTLCIQLSCSSAHFVTLSGGGLVLRLFPFIPPLFSFSIIPFQQRHISTTFYPQFEFVSFFFSLFEIEKPSPVLRAGTSPPSNPPQTPFFHQACSGRRGAFSFVFY